MRRTEGGSEGGTEERMEGSREGVRQNLPMQGYQRPVHITNTFPTEVAELGRPGQKVSHISVCTSTHALHTTYSHAAVHTGHVLPVVDIHVAVVEMKDP